MFEEYEEPFDEDLDLPQKTNHCLDTYENQKSSRLQGNSRREKQKQKKQSKDRRDLYEDRWN